MRQIYILFSIIILNNYAFAVDDFVVSTTGDLVNIQCAENKFATMTAESDSSQKNSITYKVHCLPLICVFQRTYVFSNKWNIFFLGKNTTSYPDSSLLVIPQFSLADENLSESERDINLKNYLRDGKCIESKKEIMMPIL